MSLDAFVAGAGVALFGGVIGYLLRIHESIRSDRRAAYMPILEYLDRMPLDLIEADTKAKLDAVLRDVARDMKAAERQIELLGSRRVVKAMDAIWQYMIESETGGLISDAFLSDLRRGDTSAAPDTLKAFRNGLQPLDADLRNAMRRDLMLGPLPRDHFMEKPESKAE